MKEIPFQHNGQEYVVRIVFDGATYHIRALKDGRPANGYGYTVTQETAFDLYNVHGYDALQDQVQGAIDDVKTGRWEKYVAAVNAYRQSMLQGGAV